MGANHHIHVATLVVFCLGITAAAEPVPNHGDNRMEILSSAPADVRMTYEALERLSYREFRTALHGLPVQTRVVLWQLNLRVFQSTHVDLTPTQRRVIASGIALLARPGFITGTPDKGTEEAALFAAHKDAILNAFSDEEIREAFIRFGSDPEALEEVLRPSSTSKHPPVPKQKLSDSNLQANTYYYCDCAGWFDCWWVGTCIGQNANNTCVPVIDCGFYGDEGCWGFCA